MKTNFIILIVTTILVFIAAILKIMHRAEFFTYIIFIGCLGPYMFSITRLVMSRENINQLKRNK